MFDRFRVNNTKAGSLFMSIALKVISAIAPSDREADCNILQTNNKTLDLHYIILNVY